MQANKRRRMAAPRVGESSTSSGSARGIDSTENAEPVAQPEARSLDQLAQIVTQFVKGMKTPLDFSRSEAIPEFNPERTSMTSVGWCKKIEEMRVAYGWEDEVTIHLATNKLRGLSSLWQTGRTDLPKEWADWQQIFQDAFPPKRDFYESMKRIINRKKRSDETYVRYHYEMLSQLNAIGITGQDAVSCIIGGIVDSIVQAGARAGSHQTPESLLRYFGSISDKPTTFTSRETRQSDRRRFDRKVGRSWNERKGQKLNNQDRSHTGREERTCHQCKKPGHFIRNCPETIRAEKKCQYCGKTGHVAADCYNRKRDGKTVA